MSKMSNIFEMYFNANDMIMKNPDIYSPEHFKLLNTIKGYFDSLCWAVDETDKLIYDILRKETYWSVKDDILTVHGICYDTYKIKDVPKFCRWLTKLKVLRTEK